MGSCYVGCNFLLSGLHAHHSFSVSGAYFIFVLLFMTETRSTVILTRMARKVRKDTGDGRYCARAEKNKPSLASMIKISCTRPLRKYIHISKPFAELALDLLLTEPIVQSFSVSGLADLGRASSIMMLFFSYGLASYGAFYTS
jgi:hypothetical protein